MVNENLIEQEKQLKDKYEQFLELLKNNPEAIEYQVIKNEYKELLDMAFEKAKGNRYWAKYVVPELLKVGILGKEDKEYYKKLLDRVFEEAKSNGYWAEYVVPELLKVGILGKEDKEYYKKLLDRAFEEAKSNINWARGVVPELLKLGILEKEEIKEGYKGLLDTAFEEAKTDSDWAEYVVPELLKVGILEKEDKEYYKKLLDRAFEEAKTDSDWAEYVVPELLKVGILEKEDKEYYKKLLDTAFEEAKTDSDWAEYVVPELLKLGILGKEDKEYYKKLLDTAFEEAKTDSDWAEYVVPELLKVGILEKEDKEYYKKLLDTAFEEAKTDSDWAEYVVPELLKLGILGKEDKEYYKKLLDTAFEEAKTDSDWADEEAKTDSDWAEYVVPELLKLGILEKEEIKEGYKELLDMAFEKAKGNRDWAEKVVPELLKVGILEKEDKEYYKELLDRAFEEAKTDSDWAEYVVPELLKVGILGKEDKEYYKKLLDRAFEEAKSNINWARGVVPELLKVGILEKEDKEYYKELLDIAFEEAKTDSDWAEYVVPELLKVGILEKEDKEYYKKLLDRAFEEAKTDSDWAEYVVPELLKVGILEKEDKEYYKKLLDRAFEEAKSNINWARGVVPELLKVGILEKEDKEYYKELLDIAFEEAKTDSDWAEYVVPELLKVGILEKEDKEYYKKLLDIAFEEAKTDSDWAEYVVPELLKLGILGKEDKEYYKKLLDIAFEEAKSNSDWAKYVVPELLKVGILEKEDKEYYKELLDIAFEEAKSNINWAEYVVPELLKLGILEKEEINVDMPRNITIRGTIFLEKFKDKITNEDIEFIFKCDDIFTHKEMNHLYSQDYIKFRDVENGVKNGNYAEIWNIKKICYPEEEKNKLQKTEEYFGEGIWTYFVDKVHGNKKLINRFRDPHNALLHYDKIIKIAQYLETKGISKEKFIKNYLGVAGDRNNGYQQLNNFLEKYDGLQNGEYNDEYDDEYDDEYYDEYYDGYDDEENNDEYSNNSSWLDMISQAMTMDEFKNNSDFINLANTILEKDKTGELYKNLDELEQVLTVLQMLKNKKSLIKLSLLSQSNNPDDKKLYEYYKSAIYHPRTKPIIMKMYDNPEEFLGLDDTTFSDLEKIHQAKKPSHMVTDFPFLDFDARDLVNCLPLGIYDQLSYFKPFEMKFYINGNNVYAESEIQEEIKNLLRFANQQKISVIITKLKEEGDDTMWFQIWKEDKENFIEEVIKKYDEKDLISLFVGLGYSEFNKFKDLKEMTAKISPKSDPNNRFNGFNCDSLAEGHGKKVVAMFNPYCTDFCIYEGDQDPKEDNLKVTSWVTLNREIPENFNTLLGKIKSNTTHDIAAVLGDKFEDYKDPKEYVITMDNIEANPNFGNKYAGAVRQMYEKFFSEYIRQNPISPNGIPINTSKFYSGVNYNKLDILNKKVPNQSLQVFVNAYTDNSSDYSLQGDLDAGEQKEKEKKTGIQPLSIEDVVQISYLEGKIYPESMKDYLGNLQPEITASILNNTLKGRPNLSFAWYNDEGKIGGYILAYQGKMEDGTPGIYISDFAIDEKERGTAGVKMISHWMKQVKEKYPDMPVFARAREDTSYRMVKAFAERNGYKISKDELIYDNSENRHRVVMKPKI